MSQIMNETFEVEALNKLLESLESRNIDMVKKNTLQRNYYQHYLMHYQNYYVLWKETIVN